MAGKVCTVKAIHEYEGVFCRLVKLSHTIHGAGLNIEEIVPAPFRKLVHYRFR